MSCAAFEEAVLDLARERNLDPGTRTRLLSHAAQCAGCGKRLAEARRLTEALHELAAHTERLEPPADARAAVPAASRERAGTIRTGESAPRASPARRTSGFWAQVLAAAAVLTLGLALLRFVGDGERSDPARTSAPVPTSTSLSGEEAGNAGFVPLSSGDRLEDPQGFLVIRVRLSRATIAALGVSLSGTDAREPLEVSLLVDARGVARAIRLPGPEDDGIGR